MIYKTIMIIATFLIMLCACNKPSTQTSVANNNSSSTKQTNTMHNTPQDTIDFKQLSTISLANAIEKYGQPKTQEEFTLGETHSEFRVGLGNYFTPKEIESTSIKMIEVTWEFNPKNNITAWYKAQNTSKPIEILKWKKDEEY